MTRGANIRIRVRSSQPKYISKLSSTLIGLYKSNDKNIVLTNDSMTLSCIFSQGTVIWKRLKHGVEYSLKFNERIKSIRQTTGIIIDQVTRDDDGIYVCQPNVTNSNLKINFTVIVVEPPKFVTKPEDTTVAPNKSHIFECTASGLPSPTIVWTANGKHINTILDGRRIQLHGNKIFLSNLQTTDVTVIQCNASNQYGYVYTNAYINVWNQKPMFLSPPQKYLKGVLKKNVIIKCHAFSVPPPKSFWKKDSYKLNLAFNNKYQTDIRGNLMVTNLNNNDAGVYECSASNNFGITNAESTLVIREPTTIITASPNFRKKMMNDAILECFARTDQLECQNLKIIWIKNGIVLKETNSRSIPKLKSQYQIESLSQEDSGVYVCNATNGLDWDVREIEVVVEGKPEPSVHIDIDCKKFATKQQAMLTWIDGYHNNNPITHYIVEFETQFDRNHWYQIQPSFQLNGQIKIDPQNNFKKSLIIRIQPYQNYKFRLRSVNILGISEPSISTSRHCQLTMRRPTQNPDQLFVYGTEPNSLKIRWKPVSYLFHNGPNFTYSITIRCIDCVLMLSNVEYSMTAHARNESVKIEEIQANRNQYRIEIYKRYGVKIQSKNAVGYCTSLPTEVFGYSGENYPTVIPNDLMIMKITDKSVDLRWHVINKSHLSQIHGYFRGYRIEWCFDDGPINSTDMCERKKKFKDEILFKADEDELSNRLEEEGRHIINRKKRDFMQKNSNEVHYGQNVFGKMHTTTITNLPGLTNIRIWSRIINIQYAGPKGREVKIKTKEGIPDEIAELSVEIVEINYAEIAWAKPMTINGHLLGFDIEVNEASLNGKKGPSVKVKEIRDADQVRERISDLKPATLYYLTIWGLTKRGRGKPKQIKITTKQESKESDLIQLRVNQVDSSKYNISIIFSKNLKQLHLLQTPANSVQSPRDEIADFKSILSNTRWKFFVQFRLTRKSIWEETEKQYINWWIIISNLLPQESYLFRAVINTETGSLVTQSRLIRTGSNGGLAFASILRGSGTTWVIILAVLICGLFCGIVGLFVWRRRKGMYMRGKPSLTQQNPSNSASNLTTLNHNHELHQSYNQYPTELPNPDLQLRNSMVSPFHDRYTSFANYPTAIIKNPLNNPQQQQQQPQQQVQQHQQQNPTSNALLNDATYGDVYSPSIYQIHQSPKMPIHNSNYPKEDYKNIFTLQNDHQLQYNFNFSTPLDLYNQKPPSTPGWTTNSLCRDRGSSLPPISNPINVRHSSTNDNSPIISSSSPTTEYYYRSLASRNPQQLNYNNAQVSSTSVAAAATSFV